MNILIFLLILLVLVLVHEFGHFFSAKKFGIRVDEFGFGFPPKLFGVKKGETEYTFNLLPLGGFVKIFGENPDEASLNGPDSKRSFINKPKWQQSIVLGAGIFANILLAWVLFSVSFMSGLPVSVSDQNFQDKITDKNLVVLSVLKDSPAEKSGLLIGDKILSISDESTTILELNPEKFREFVSTNENQELIINYQRGNSTEINILKITPEANLVSGAPGVGVALDQIGIAKFSFFESIFAGAKYTWLMTKGTALGFYNLITQSIQGKGDVDSLSGPVGLVSIVGNASKFGFIYLLSFTAIISINLAVLNLVPFPALDGGRLLFVLIEKIKGKRLSPAFANTANMVGFLMLILLMLFVTYHDIVKLF